MLTGNKSIVCLILTAILSTAAGATGATDPESADIDAVFADYDNTVSPGCALGVIRDGELIYKRGYGMANLEYDIALSPRSVFRTGSVGKQFTAMAIAILDEQGKISLDDPLSNHFPEFPGWADGIKVRNLVHHNSGIRDYLTLTWLAGMGDDDFYTDEFALDLLSRQKRHNFQPGEEYLYSNSGYLLLAHIVKRATDQTLREWAAESMFGPLRMADTHFHDDHTHVVPNRASGYAPTDDGYKISETTLDMVGDGGVYTTIEDLLLWDRNFYDNKLGNGGPALLQTVTTPGVFNSGEEMTYAFGLDVEEYRGLRRVSHGGAFVGFRAYSTRYPDQRFATYVLCNRADADPGTLAERVSALYLGDLMEPLDEAGTKESPETLTAVEVEPSRLEALSGHYWSADQRAFLEIEWADGTLSMAPYPGEIFDLVPQSDDRLAMTTPWWTADLIFAPSSGENPQLTFRIRGRDNPQIYEGFDPRQISSSELQEYTGSYRSGELDIEYSLEEEDGALTFEIGHRGKHLLEAKFGETFHNADYGIFTFERGEGNKVVGFSLDAGRVTNLEFTRR